VTIRLALLVAALFQPATFVVTDARDGSPVYPVLLRTLASDRGRPVEIQKVLVTRPDEVVAVARPGKMVALSAGDFAVATRHVAALLPDNSIALLRMARLHVTIREAASKMPIPGARIQILSGRQQINIRGFKVPANGQVAAPCEPGPIRVSAWSLGYSQATTSVAVDSGADVQIVLELQPAVVLRGQFPAFAPLPTDGYVEARPTGPPAMFAVGARVRANRFELHDLSVGGSYDVRYSSGQCRAVTIAKVDKLAPADISLTLPIPPCEPR
jgi:hypothetical protein